MRPKAIRLQGIDVKFSHPGARLLLPTLVVLLPCVFSCGSRAESADAPERAVALLASADGTPGSGGACSDFALSAPRTVDLGQSFAATAMRRLLGRQTWVVAANNTAYSWDGEGFGIAAQGVRASVDCTWSGSHTLEVTRASDGCKATALVRCEPPLCSGTSGPCPGVPTKGTTPPTTNLLVRIREGLSAPPGQFGTDAVCPAEIGAWVGGPLLRVRDEQGDATLYCSYAWVASPEYSPNVDAITQRLGTDVQWDEPNVAAHGEYAEMHAKLASQSRAQLGVVSWPPAPAPEPVRIAVVDTAANFWRDPDNNPHGVAVGALALDTACKDSPSCKVSAENFLALPLYRDTETSPAVVRRDVLHGGSFGAHGDFARAIRDASNAAPVNARTIINLSVAYDSDELVDGVKVKPTDYSNQVVLDALQYAHCRGALIVAAAGNGPVPAQSDQLAGLPARWTAVHALPASECQARFGIANPRPGNGTGPLLYAISGLDFGANPLLTTRGSGQSALAAVAFAAVREVPNGGYTRTLTGSSMSAASVSGIAAALWSHAPSLTPDAVIAQLYAASEPVAADADFVPYAPSGRDNGFAAVRRITLCSAATAGYAVCVEPPVPSPVVAKGTVPPLPAGSAVEIGKTLESSVAGPSPWKYPWLFPQPEGEPGCGACALSLRDRGVLSLGFRSSFPLSMISNMRVRVRVPIVAASFALQGDESVDESLTMLKESAVPNLSLDPFTVTLGYSTIGATAAELVYVVAEDDVSVSVEESESVLLQ
ncbi:MAG TPA: S8/S53 family peptidase [Polyangiaceae bacterium]|nr:S8/S53 family peptidase [Polyangiaceae bacterium]